MRRLPVYLLLDVSGSMRGEPIISMKTGVQVFLLPEAEPVCQGDRLRQHHHLRRSCKGSRPPDKRSGSLSA